MEQTQLKVYIEIIAIPSNIAMISTYEKAVPRLTGYKMAIIASNLPEINRVGLYRLYIVKIIIEYI